MADQHRHINYRLLTLAACLHHSLPEHMRSEVINRARRSRIDEMLLMREPFANQDYNFRISRAEMIGVCHACGKSSCTQDWQSETPEGDCDLGMGIGALYGRTALNMAFIWGNLADDYWALKLVCNCESCKICEWRDTLLELLSI